MIYKKVEQGGDRYVIIDGESRLDEMRVTPNLADDQFKIELLIADTQFQFLSLPLSPKLFGKGRTGLRRG